MITLVPLYKNATFTDPALQGAFRGLKENLEKSVTADIVFGTVEINQRIDINLKIFRPDIVAKAKRVQGILLLLGSRAFYEDKGNADNSPTFLKATLFGEIPTILKFLVEGIEASLATKVVYFGWPGGGKDQPISWLRVPTDIKVRHAAPGSAILLK